MSTQKRKILDTKYGIAITKPWNEAMYKHNDKVAEVQKAKIKAAAQSANLADDLSKLSAIYRAVAGAGILGVTCDECYSLILEELERVQCWWLHDYCWPDLLKANIVKPLTIFDDGVAGYVGYDK